MNVRISRLRTWSTLGLLITLGLGSGCGGITATKSVSPLNFLLPGLLKADPPQPVGLDATNNLVCLRN